MPLTSTFQLEGEQQGDRGQVGVGLGLCLANKEPRSKVSVITEMGREGRADEELRGRLKNKTERKVGGRGGADWPRMEVADSGRVHRVQLVNK